MRDRVLIALASGVVCSAVTLALTAGLSQVGADCMDEPCANPPCCNGDTNGDGDINIADAVYLLTYLFAQGPVPASRPHTERFVDNGDGTVTDTITGLMWQRDTADTNGDGSIGDEDQVTKSTAREYVSSLRLGAYDDWELPNTRDLYSIVDFTRWDPCIDPVFQAEVSSYWISSTNGGDPCHGSDFALYFGGGFISVSGDGEDSTYVAYVRAVRTIK